jgi:2,3-bisphosphoglycerate-dependent phosphoglycerate mutase
MSKLILGRHGETIFNAEGRWTGHTDVLLTERGREESREAGRYIAERVDVINAVHYSMLRRTFTSAMAMLGEIACCPDIDIQAHAALNERDYGIYTGQRKQDIREQYGQEEFMRIRRGWDHPIPGGESLKDVSEQRIVPFHENIIVPDLSAGKNSLVVSSNNPLRAYVKYLEAIPDNEAPGIELGTAEVRIYDFDEELNIVGQTSHVIGDVH